jgi:mRNA interferase MazF
MNIKRGSIFLVNLDPVIGKEISKTRPVVIISNDINNKYSGTITILPITTKNIDKLYPFEVLLEKGEGNVKKKSKIKVDQIRTIDRSRFHSFIGSLNEKIMSDIKNALKIHLAIS